MHSAVQAIKGQLVVSCQAYPGEPMRHPETMAQMARAAEIGGAAAIRCQGLSDISLIKSRVEIPVIGLWKEGHEGVFITPTIRHARACVGAGADIVALDATDRLRPDGSSFAEIVKVLKDEGAAVMADCGSLSDVERAAEAGCDILSTTLAGYTSDRPKTEGPDLEFVAEILRSFPDFPVVCEGRIRTPQDVSDVMSMGAWSVVVGTSITHPTTLTQRFIAAL